MNQVATLVVKAAASGDAAALARDAAGALAAAGARTAAPDWLAADHAADIAFDGVTADAARHALGQALAGAPVDLLCQPADGRRKAMLIADMDSTMITVECIDELADFAGLKPQVAAITEQAMRGALDFEAALKARVALLEGMDAGVLEQVYADRVRFMPGSAALVRTMAAAGAQTILVSGGFTFFTERVAAHLGFAMHRANQLQLTDGRLAGTVCEPVVTADTKLATLRRERDGRSLSPAAVVAVGDGANDIPMLREAGLGVAYHAKPRAREAADATIDHNDLTALLYFQGYRRDDIVGSEAPS